MEDGSVVISILGDRKHIAKEMEATRKDIEKTEKKLAACPELVSMAAVPPSS